MTKFKKTSMSKWKKKALELQIRLANANDRLRDLGEREE